MYNLFVSFFPEPEGTTPGGEFIRLVIIVPYFAKAQMLLFLNSAKNRLWRMNNKAYEVYSLDFHTNIFLSTLNFYKSEIGL